MLSMYLQIHRDQSTDKQKRFHPVPQLICIQVLQMARRLLVSIRWLSGMGVGSSFAVCHCNLDEPTLVGYYVACTSGFTSCCILQATDDHLSHHPPSVGNISDFTVITHSGILSTSPPVQDSSKFHMIKLVVCCCASYQNFSSLRQLFHCVLLYPPYVN